MFLTRFTENNQLPIDIAYIFFLLYFFSPFYRVAYLTQCDTDSFRLFFFSAHMVQLLFLYASDFFLLHYSFPLPDSCERHRNEWDMYIVRYNQYLPRFDREWLRNRTFLNQDIDGSKNMRTLNCEVVNLWSCFILSNLESQHFCEIFCEFSSFIKKNPHKLAKRHFD